MSPASMCTASRSGHSSLKRPVKVYYMAVGIVAGVMSLVSENASRFFASLMSPAAVFRLEGIRLQAMPGP